MISKTIHHRAKCALILQTEEIKSKSHISTELIIRCLQSIVYLNLAYFYQQSFHNMNMNDKIKFFPENVENDVLFLMCRV